MKKVRPSHHQQLSLWDYLRKLSTCNFARRVLSPRDFRQVRAKWLAVLGGVVLGESRPGRVFWEVGGVERAMRWRSFPVDVGHWMNRAMAGCQEVCT